MVLGLVGKRVSYVLDHPDGHVLLEQERFGLVVGRTGAYLTVITVTKPFCGLPAQTIDVVISTEDVSGIEE